MEVEEPADNMTVVRNEMIAHLVSNRDVVFKSQQVGEPDLSDAEKRCLVEACLDSKPLSFLSRFSRYLESSHFEYFKRVYPDLDYEISYYLRENSLTKSETVVKNRRLEALKRLAVEGDFFSEDEMRKRNPLLYEHLVGRYLTEEERKQKNSFSRAAHTEEGCKLSSLLLEQYERDVASDLMRQQEDAEEEIESDSDDELSNGTQDDRVLHLWGESNSASNVIDTSKRISDEEKKLLFEEFRSNMYRSFIGGSESHFDYSNVDSNAEFDDLDEMDRDAQDKYFASDSPEDVEMDDSKPQALRSEEVQDVPDDTYTGISNGSIADEPKFESRPPTPDSNSIGLKEDPLDLFMDEIEEEISHQQLNSQMKSAGIK